MSRKQQMDSQFNTLSRSYHDNYIQYKTTGKSSYKSAYESAAQGLESIIQSLQDQVDETNQNIQDAVGQDAAQAFKNKQATLANIGVKLQKENDRIVGGQLRDPSVIASPSYTGQYIAIFLLALGAAGLAYV